MTEAVDAAGAGARPATLMEALSKRIVEALKAEIANATAEVQDVGHHTSRLEEQLAQRLGELDGRLSRIESLLSHPAGSARPAGSAGGDAGADGSVAAPIDRTAVIEAVEEAMAGARTVITNAVDRRLSDFEAFVARSPLPVGDGGATFDPAFLFDVIEPMTERVLTAIADVHVAVAGLPAATPADPTVPQLDALRIELQQLREEVEAARVSVQRSIEEAAAGRPDPQPVLDAIAAQAAELQVTVCDRIDGIERALGAQPDPLPAIAQVLDLIATVDHRSARGTDMRPLLNEIGCKLAEVHGSLIGRLDHLTAQVGALPDIRPLHDDVVERLDRVQAGVDRQPDFTPLLEELGARLAETGDTIHGRFDELAGDVAGVRDAVASQPDVRPVLAELGQRLDTVTERIGAVGDSVAAGPDFAPVVGEIGVRLVELRAEIASWIGGVVDGVATVHEQLAAGTDYTPLLDGMATRLAEVRTALRAGIDELRAAGDDGHHGTREAFERAVDDVRMAIALSQEAAELGRETIGTNVATICGRLERVGDQVDHVTGRVEDVFGHLGNLADQVTDQVEAVEHRVGTAGDAVGPLISALGDRLTEVADGLHGRLDRIETTTQATGRELATSIEQLSERAAAAIAAAHAAESEARAALAAQVAELHADVRAGQDLTPVLDAIGGAREAISLVVDAVTAAHQGDLRAIEEQRSAVAELVGELAGRLAALQQAVGEGVDLEPLAEQVRDAVASIAAQVDESRQALAARVGEIEVAVSTAAARLTTEVGAVRELAEAGVDLSPVALPLASGVASLERAIADVQAVVTAGPDLSEITGLLGEVAGRVAAGPDFTPVVQTLKGAFTAMLELTSREPDLTPVTTRLAEVERLLRALDVSIETGTPGITNAAVAELTGAVRRLQSDVVMHAEEIGHTVAGAVGDAVATLRNELAAARPNDEVALVARRLEVIEAALFDVAGLLNREPVPAGPDRTLVAEVETALARHSVTIGDLAQEIRSYASLAAANPGMQELTDAANASLARLERMAEAVLVRIERRQGELAAGTAELEGALDRSADRIVAQVSSIAEGLAASERLVRERFVELETAVSEVRGDAAQIRSVRSGLEAIGQGLEMVRALVGQVAGSSDVSRVANGVVEISNELRATVERLGDLDRRFATLRSEVGESAGITRATFKAASNVAQLGEELEEIRQRLDAMVASLVTDGRLPRAIGPGPDQPR